MPQDEEENLEKLFRVSVTISSLGNESRVIKLGECTQSEATEVIKTVSQAFETIRKSQTLMLSGKDGTATFANLDNVVFVEVHIA